jgi:uncharacterized protein
LEKCKLCSEEKNLFNIVEWFMNNTKPVIIAFSGGVDSAVVAFAAKKALDNDAIAITANYDTLSNDELASAKNIAKELKITHKIIGYNELANPQFIKNNASRCYHCRAELASHLLEEARKLGAGLIVDGTQMDDLSDIRPGIRALKENGIRSPLVECGVNKDQVRAIARYSGLSVHNDPRTPVSPQNSNRNYYYIRQVKEDRNAETIVKALFLYHRFSEGLWRNCRIEIPSEIKQIVRYR